MIDDKLPECLESIDENHEVLLKSYYGRLEGINYTIGTPESPYHTTLALGVAYAYNAIGEFRFRQSLTVPAFGLLSTKRFEKSCAPNKHYPGSTDFNEDCLFLNIFLPDEQYRPKQGFPVLFLIHGGAFNYGTSTDFEIDPIVTLYVKKGLAVVTPNYRLGPYGWFNVGVNDRANNVGLWDLRKAFEFALFSSKQLNLNPKRFTIGGIDSGAILAELLAFRREIRNDINGLIMISGGSSLSPWAFSENIYSKSVDLAEKLNIKFNDSRDLLHGIKMTPMEDIAQIQADNSMSVDDKNFVEFTPSFDENFFRYNDFKKMMYNSKPIPILAITTNNEGLFRSTKYSKKYFNVFNEFTGLTKEEQKNFNCSNFHQFLKKFFNKSKQLLELTSYYKCDDSKNDAFNLYSGFIGDYWFTIPQAFSYLLYAELDHPVYVSVVETNDNNFAHYFGSSIMPSSILADSYLFSIQNTFDPLSNEKTQFEFIQNSVINDIVQFVSEGKLNWSSISTTSYRQLKIPHQKIDGKTLTSSFNTDDQFFDKKLKFWRRFLRKYGFDTLSSLLPEDQDIFTFKY